MLSRFELRRFHGFLPVAALLFALLVPVLYGAVYLSANWDPYGNLKNLPVAIVDADQPVTYAGETIAAGRDITNELVEQQTFDWQRTTLADAEAGLATGRYYLVMEIPSTFSADLTSASEITPHRAQITLRRNDANGFVIGSVTASAQSKIESAVDKAAVDAYFRAVFSNLAKMRAGIADAASGSQKITDGLASAKAGSGKLASGLTTADAGAGKLAAGASTLNSKMPALAGGASDLSSGLKKLDAGSATLASGAQQVAAGTQQLRDTVVPVLDKVIAVQGQVASQVDSVNRAVQKLNGRVNGSTGRVSTDLDAAAAALDRAAAADPAFKASPAYQDASAALKRASGRASSIEKTSATVASDTAAANAKVQSFVANNTAGDAKTKLTQLNDGAHQVASGASTLHAGIGTASAVATKLSAGVGQVSDAVGQLSSGAASLKAGVGQLSAGASELDAGLGKLQAGSATLTDGLRSAVQQIPALTEKQAEDAALVLSSPVNVTMDVWNPANVYGRGLAPLFFSIAMWVFGISGFLIMRPISSRVLAGRLYPLRAAIAAWVPIGTVAVAGALIMLGVTWWSLGLDPVNPTATIGLTVLAALVFSGIAHCLRTALGLPGSAALLIWLVLQLSSTGGTYPAAVLPPFFQAIQPFMPITYTIDAYRVAISGGLWGHFVTDVVILLGIGAVAMAVDVWAVMHRQRFRMADLHPPLEG